MLWRNGGGDVLFCEVIYIKGGPAAVKKDSY